MNFTNVRGELVRVAEPFHDVVRRSWRVSDAAARQRVVDEAYTETVARLSRMRRRFEEAVTAERVRLEGHALQPWPGRPADRAEFVALVAELAEKLTDAAAAFAALEAALASDSTVRQVAVLRVAWDHGWREVLEHYRVRTEDLRQLSFDASPVGQLLAFETHLERSGLCAASFELGKPELVEESA